MTFFEQSHYFTVHELLLVSLIHAWLSTNRIENVI